MSLVDAYFSIQTFFIVLRETLESAIIISVLLSFVHQTFNTNRIDLKQNESNNTDDNPPNLTNGQYHAVSQTTSNSTSISLEENQNDEKLCNFLKLQIWFGGLLGILVCLMVGSVILAVFYFIGNDLWSVTEHYWEGTFSILASIIISVMGIKILRVSKMQDKWKLKLGKLIKSSRFFNTIEHADEHIVVKPHGGIFNRFELWSEKYSMIILPFVTTLREGLEAIVFIGGIGINENTSIWAIVNAAIAALIIGSLIGVALYRSGNTLSLQWFLIISTCFLYLVAAGLFSKGIWNFELQHFIDQCGGQDVSETGHGPGSYDIAKSVWHVNCCNGEMQEDGAFWMIFTAIFGWTNSATYGSVIGYILYWVVIIIAFTSLTFEEKYGYLPVIPISWQMKRIRKRVDLYQQLPNDQSDPRLTRVSVDSINSSTPLQ
ncbi:FTH1 [Candida pseudojiufengensis]|uniref:FTH1 n=1 Tax=Candida pseudojiufengensis TaxID=497109 RepID=UPI00222460A1|nr:FTH1 [Candida pseudojiufengensis]KAI5964804.1 FTH1 [Candida pseudojiufengensis]